MEMQLKQRAEQREKRDMEANRSNTDLTNPKAHTTLSTLTPTTTTNPGRYRKEHTSLAVFVGNNNLSSSALVTSNIQVFFFS
jgi:hypothetical protein